VRQRRPNIELERHHVTRSIGAAGIVIVVISTRTDTHVCAGGAQQRTRWRSERLQSMRAKHHQWAKR
jgi:hypothetical protein